MIWHTPEDGGRTGVGVVQRAGSRLAWWLLLLGGALAIGAAAAAEGNSAASHRGLAVLFILAVLGLSALVVFAQLGATALVAWPPLAVAGYLLVQFPRSHPVITFDRVWVGGLLAYILLTPQPFRAAPASRFFSRALAVFICAYGLRALWTSFQLSGPVETWFDGVVLPAIVFFAVTRYAATLDRVERLAGSMMIAGGILGGIGVAERIFGFELATLSGGGAVRHDADIGLTRVSGPYPVPEPYALAVLMCLAATLYWVQTRKGTPALWGIGLAGLQVAGITFSLFRAAWIAGILVLIGAVGVRPRRFARTLAVTIAVAALAGAGSTQLQHNRAFEERTQNTSNIYGRLATYAEGVEIFRTAPLAGVGVDQFNRIATHRKPTVYHNVAAVDWPHSSYVAVLSEQGLLGFVPVILVTVAGWVLIRRLRASAVTREDGVLAGCVGGAAAAYMIMSLTLTMLPYEPSNAFFALLLGLTAARLNAISGEGAWARSEAERGFERHPVGSTP